VIRATPTGILHTAADQVEPQSPAWHEARRVGIGSSDIPKILGLSRYGTAAHVWLEKTARTASDEGSEAAEWGTVLEDPIARQWVKRYSDDRFRISRIGMVRNDTVPWMLASPDRRVLGCIDAPHGCGLEVKMRSAFKAGEWSSTIPDDVLAQTQWQLAVTGWPHIHVAALVGQHLEMEDVYPDQDVQAYVVEKAAAVWQHVLDDTEPELPAGDLLVDYLDRLYADREENAVLEVVDPAQREELGRVLYRYRHWRRIAKDAKDGLALAKGDLVKLAADAEVVTVDHELAFSRRLAGARRSTNYKLLQAAHPEVYDEVVTTGEPARRLSVPGEDDE
jgi:putative phage-type endonuclease